ncbi:MAG TPA: hypothetical protein VF245_08810 [Solirubrobacterales bacterium]
MAPTEATTPAPEHDFAFIELSLPTNNGLEASLETNSEGVYLEVHDDKRFAVYKVQGESTDAGLKARFGSLGKIDVAFQPTEVHLERPPKPCTGEPSTNSEGLFVGTIEFSGEGEYVRIETTQVKGTMWVDHEADWKCPHRKPPASPHTVSRTWTLSHRGRAGQRREPATLAVANRRCDCYFAAYGARNRRGQGWSSFIGAKFEQGDGMEARHFTYVNAGPSAFAFNHDAGTARVRPPEPFTGSGTFERRRRGPDVWRSTIQVPLLGADPLNVGEPGFRAKLVRALPGGE